MQPDEELLLEFDAGPRGSLRLMGKRSSISWQYRLQWIGQNRAQNPVDWLHTDPRYRWVYSWQEALKLLEVCDGLRMRPLFTHPEVWGRVQQTWGMRQPNERELVTVGWLRQ